MSKKVLITGAGIGGLATALRLAKKGFDVEMSYSESKRSTANKSINLK